MPLLDPQLTLDTPVIGRMVCVDFCGCDPAVLESESDVKQAMDGLCEAIRIQVVGYACKSFGPGCGVTSVNVLATSSLNVHTWPEIGVACIDLFSCTTDFDDAFVERYFAEAFRADDSARTSFDRINPATPTPTGRFSTPGEPPLSRPMALAAEGA
jgi:S-adenosylmethionine decarboxylase